LFAQYKKKKKKQFEMYQETAMVWHWKNGRYRAFWTQFRGTEGSCETSIMLFNTELNSALKVMPSDGHGKCHHTDVRNE